MLPYVIILPCVVSKRPRPKEHAIDFPWQPRRTYTSINFIVLSFIGTDEHYINVYKKYTSIASQVN